MNKARRFTKLLQPGQIGRLKTKNRLVRSAAGTDYLDEQYFPKMEKQLPFYEALARGGVGLIILGGAVVDYPLGNITPCNVRFDDDKFIPGFRQITDLVHKYDCPIFLQVHHGGPWRGIFNMLTGDTLQPASSSAMSRSELQALGQDFGLPTRELTTDEIKRIVSLFADSAARGQKAGFDGIEVNVATGHLGNSFLSRAWNKRQDEYGAATLENRARFAVEIITETKKQLGPDYPVGILMNGAEFGTANALTPEEGQGIAGLFEKAGADYIHVRSYGYGEYWDLHIPDSIFFPDPPVPLARPLDGSRHGAGVALPLAARIKKVVSIPVIAVGRLDPELGEAALEGGKADFIAMQRRLIADPDLPNKVAAGRLEDIAPCTGCLACFVEMQHCRPVRCRINAAIGGNRDYTIDKAPVKKKVVVVGGGPAGMEAARVAALRGHQVMLYEKERRLGGLMPMASLMKNSGLENLQQIIDYLKTQLNKLGVDIRLGKEFSPSLVEDLKPDVLIVASGGIPVIPQIPGIESRKVLGMPRLHSMIKRLLRYVSPAVLKVLTRLWMPIGKKVVVMGGGIHGFELAELLTRAGRRVSMVDTAKTLQDDRWTSMQNVHMMGWLERRGVAMLTEVRYDAVTDNGLLISTKEGRAQTIEADSIIPVIPLEPDSRLFVALKGKVAEIFPVGDGAEPGLIMDAIAAAYETARRI